MRRLAVLALGALLVLIAGGVAAVRWRAGGPGGGARAKAQTAPLFDVAPGVQPGRAGGPAGQALTALRFEDGTAASGIDFRHVPARTSERYMPEVMGSGVVIADFDRDGSPDVVLLSSGDLRARERPPAARNRLYLSDGRGRFTDRTGEWELPSPGYGMGAAAGDYDNDGWTDLFLTGYGPGSEMLLRNAGGRRFEDVTRAARIAPDGRWSTSAGFFDLEGDGDLDLYIVRYIDYTLANAIKCYHNQVHVYCTPILYDGVPDRVLRNNGDGTFTDVSRASGVADFAGKGLALVIGDIDLDGDADVYVANDTARNNLWINDGSGRFRDDGQLCGVALSEAGAEEAGMGADLSDVNADGLLDIVCTNFQGETTSIYRQGPGRFFREVSDAIGIGEAARARLSFGVDFFDADLDGDEDLLVANGHIEDNVATYSSSVTFEQQNTLYESLGDGRFRDVSDAAGPALAGREVNRGLATGDLDGDGDIDFIATRNGGPVLVGINVSAKPGHFVGLWLEGRRSNRSAIGARVVAKVAAAGGGERTLERQVHGASSYLSISDSRIQLGLGEATEVAELAIYWPGKASEPQVVRGLEAGREYHIVEGEEPVAYVPGSASRIERVGLP